jgi:hypothetical protein
MRLNIFSGCVCSTTSQYSAKTAPKRCDQMLSDSLCHRNADLSASHGEKYLLLNSNQREKDKKSVTIPSTRAKSGWGATGGKERQKIPVVRPNGGVVLQPPREVLERAKGKLVEAPARWSSVVAVEVLLDGQRLRFAGAGELLRFILFLTPPPAVVDHCRREGLLHVFALLGLDSVELKWAGALDSGAKMGETGRGGCPRGATPQSPLFFSFEPVPNFR